MKLVAEKNAEIEQQNLILDAINSMLESEIQKLKLQFLKEIQKNIQLEQIRHLSVDQIASDTFGNE